jgi:hypothetical protein
VKAASKARRAFPVPFGPRWRGRYVWWAQLLQGVFGLAVVWWVWRLAGGTLADFGDVRNPRPAIIAVVAFAGLTVASTAAELEARWTERRREQRRLSDLFGIDTVSPSTIPDGYVLAYHLVDRWNPLAEVVMPTLTVAAIPADRWDINVALWRFVVEPCPWPRVSRLEGGVRLTILNESFGALVEAGPLMRELAAGRPDQVHVLERILMARGARDVTPARTTG